MRSPVYRNLDTPFEIFGFSPLELVILVAVFVGSGEFAEAIGIHRLWALLAVIGVAACIHFFRRAMGERFFHRLFRFARLPGTLNARLFSHGDRP